ncbi:aquaporin-like protein [Aaosphaeria arxii CBS 175.79]|uniref:Aquaporin-like protein n=1 Tax=Aaosphaeria arxii CBS 175.79 TaxID=1450172 RepID=A0A6A5XY75_9PLEO|nr:aquaporin-like protein [Aaosphaeria arxii CBS 175.79]KAF2018258.1 aquaporin-like protein [Aaosphaeria arxii CBS 175.79]
MSEKRESIGLPPPSTNGVEHTRRPDYARQELTVFVGEFIGTFMFLFFAFTGTQIAAEAPSADSTLPDAAKLLYINLCFGISLAVNVAIFADVSGGMFNPAVTTGLLIAGVVRWQRAIHAILAQLIAAICVSFVVSALLPGPLPVATTLVDSMSISRGLFLEMFITAQLVLAVLFVPASAGKPFYVGLALFIAEMGSVYYTGGSVNPARSFGPSVVVGFKGYHWIYWLGPVLGAALGASIFMLIPLIKGRRYAAE